MLAAGSTGERVQPPPAALQLPSSDQAANAFPRELVRIQVARPQKGAPAGDREDAIRNRSRLGSVTMRRHI